MADKIRNKKVEKRIWKRKKKRGRIFFEKKWKQLKKLRKELEKNWKENGKKVKAERKFRRNVGKIGEEKVEKKLRKNSMLVQNSYMSVQ